MRAQSRRAALCGVLCALAEVVLLLGGLIPAALYACPILAMVALLPAREECGVRFALVSWAAVGLLALLLCPDKELAGVYLALGWYPPLQERFEAIRPKGLRAAAKLFVFLLCVLGLYAALIWLFQLESVVRETAEATPLLLLALLGTGCVTFLLTDVLLRRFTVLWRRKLRGRWMRGG